MKGGADGRDACPEMDGIADVRSFRVGERRLHSATHEEILTGCTTDVYFVKARDVLRDGGRLDTEVTAEIFARRSGVYAGLEEVLTLLDGRKVTVHSLREGDAFAAKEVLVRICGPYEAFGVFETVMLGMLASASAWATAARECVDAAEEACPVLWRTACTLGGPGDGADCAQGRRLCRGQLHSRRQTGRGRAVGTVPHAAVLIMGDTVELALRYDAVMPDGEPRIVLVDTFKDEAEETLRVAAALGDRLNAVRLDTPGERGGVSPELVAEVRYRLDKAGFPNVRIVASGGLSPDRIRELARAGADSFGVGSYISHAAPIDMTMDLKEVGGVPIAKRGRLPGRLDNPRLGRVL